MEKISKEQALSILWHGRDGILKPDLSQQVAAALEFNGKLPLKGVEQLRKEGIWLEDDGETKQIGQGVTLINSFLPEGCVTCELAELISGVGEPKIWPSFTDTKQVMNYRTQRALKDGFGWKPDGIVGWIYYK